jgi:ribosome-associated heat shock protein Hsp15
MPVRVDKWLWAVRLYKSRSLATEACKAGKVSIEGIALKPSRELKIGEIVHLKKDHLHLQVKVLQFAEKRMGNALVADFLQDLTPADEYEKLNPKYQSANFEYRPSGIGRPTKRDRRDMEEFKDFDF